jgi:choline-glycine betaine transporter
MSLVLLLITLLLAIAVSMAVVRLFSNPLDNILKRIIADEISASWLIYLKFAILVVGVSAGVRIRDIEKYAMPLRGDKDVPIFDFTFERWVLEIYRTVIDTLQGIVWMLLVFFIFSLLVYVIVRIAEIRFGPAKDWPRAPAAKSKE